MPHMLNVVQQNVALGDTEGAKHVFDVCEAQLILGRWSVTVLLSARIPQPVQDFVQIGADRNVDNDLRIQALDAPIVSV